MAKSNFIIILAIIVLLIVGFYIGRPLIFVNRATSYTSTPAVLENSYLFASPLQAKADNQELIRVTVFVLNDRGLGIANQQVELKTKPTLQVNTIQAITDDLGKAVFDLGSLVPGKFEISATANNKSLPQKLNIIYY